MSASIINSSSRSLYIAFAISPSISFHTLREQYQSKSNKYCLNLCKGQQVIFKTHSFTIDEIATQKLFYLHLVLNNFNLQQQSSTLIKENYSIKLTEQTQTSVDIIYDQQINLNQYINDYRINNVDCWAQEVPTVIEGKRFMLRIQKTLFMKSNKHQLDQIVNCQQIAEENDTVAGLDQSSKINQSPKRKIDQRKLRSLQSVPQNFTPIHPRRLDTISQEESNIPMTDRKDKDKQDFIYHTDSRCERKTKQRYSEGIKATQDMFESALKRQVTWIEGNGNNNVFDELVSALQHSSTTNHLLLQRGKQNEGKTKVKTSLENKFKKKDVKPSKLIKTPQHKQNNHQQLSFLDKSSLISDLEKSQMNVTSSQEICFKLKWIILIVIVVVLGVFSSLSTDAFDLALGQKDKVKKDKHAGKSQNDEHKKDKAPKLKQKVKPIKNKSKKQIHV